MTTKNHLRYYGRRAGGYLLQQLFWRKHPLFRSLVMLRVRQRIEAVERSVIPPRQVHLENTNMCNSRCIMCPYSQMQRPKGIMDIELFRKGLREASELGATWIQPQFFGEPFLDKTFGKKLALCKAMGFYVSIHTNGSVMGVEQVQMLLDNEVDEVHVSIDSLSAETFESIRRGLKYEDVAGNVERLMQMRRQQQRTKPMVWVNYLEMPENQGESETFFRHWNAIVDRVNVSFARSWGDHCRRDDVQRIDKLRFPCPSPWQQLVVTAQGNILPCCQDYEGQALSLGNLRDISLREAWEGEKMKWLREKLLTCKYDEIPLCRDCYPNDILGWRK